MQSWSREFLLMMTRTLSVSWFGGINPPCAVCSANLLERTSLSQTILRSKHSLVRIKTSVVFAVRPVFPRGFTESPTIAFEKTRAAGRNLWESTRNNFKRNTTPRWPIPL